MSKTTTCHHSNPYDRTSSTFHTRQQGGNRVQEQRVANYTGPLFSTLNHKPVGIPRPWHKLNCAFNAILQCMFNTTYFRHIIDTRENSTTKMLRPFITHYAQAQQKGSQVAKKIDTQVVRKHLASAQTSSWRWSQEDAFDVWSALAKDLSAQAQLSQTRDDAVSRQMQEPLIDLYLGNESSNFPELMSQFFCYATDNQRIIKNRLQHNPNVLVVRANRACWNQQSQTKYVSDALIKKIPDTYQLPPYMSATYKQSSTYHLKGCVIHQGTYKQGGHYVSLQKKGNTWYLVNDESVTTIKDTEARKLLEKGYIFFYENTNLTPPSVKSRQLNTSLVNNQQYRQNHSSQAPLVNTSTSRWSVWDIFASIINAIRRIWPF